MYKSNSSKKSDIDAIPSDAVENFNLCNQETKL